MLRIERMEVSGFKSFCERTQIEFPDGITAVVGPNGCGKSNIADAIAWVLGEQSPRALRGQRMEDVIFSGTEGRPAGGMAEVTLFLIARSGALDDGRTRVSFTRRLYRTGDSEYLIDGQKARLHDIRLLLEQVRAGARTYAIIDQSHVASFVISKPKERRLFIEEAAGIAGYKDRRRLADLKLEGTRANLLRVEDILREVERQRKTLQRQAALARRARKHDEELTALKGVYYRRRGLDLMRQADDLGELLAVAQREASHLERERARLAEVVAAARHGLEATHHEREVSLERAHQTRFAEERLVREIEAARVRARQLEEEAGRHEGEDQRLAAQRTEKAQELAAIEAGLADFRRVDADREAEVTAARVRAGQHGAALQAAHAAATGLEQALYDHLHQRADRAARLSAAREAESREAHRHGEAEQALTRLAALRQEGERALKSAQQDLELHGNGADRLANEVRDARAAEDLAQHELELSRAREAELAAELGARSGEKAALDSLEVRFAGADAVREVLERAQAGGVSAHHVVADVLSAGEDVERAAESFLADLLPAVVVDGDRDILAGAQLGVRGRVRFFALDTPLDTPRPHQGALPEALAADPRVAGLLSARLAARGDVGQRLAAQAEDAVLVSDLGTALALHRQYPQFNFLTPEGHAVLSSGLVSIEGGDEARQDGLLARARRRVQLDREVGILDQRRTLAAQELQQRRIALATAQAARRQAEELLAETRRRVATARMSQEQAERDLQRVEREIGMAQSVREAAQRGRDEAAQRAHALDLEVAAADRQMSESRQALDRARAALQACEQVARDAGAMLAQLLAEQRGQRERGDALVRDRDRLAREIGDTEARREESSQTLRQAMHDAQELARQAAGREADLATARADRQAAEAEAAQGAARIDEMTAAVRAADERAALAGVELEEARARREQGALAAERAKLEREHLVAACVEDLGRPPHELPADVPAGLVLEPYERDDDTLLYQRMQRVRDKRERLGLVNLLAEQEFAELSARWEDLSGQKADLDQTLEELKESIRKMDRESRERFLEAFSAIRRHFREQFAALFRGGRADIILEDEENPLEAGIEIICQPPGKKLQSVTLLSGGEKALAATAVLFAIFRYQPPPFCLLDEVDAPLDDANVGRFTDGLRHFTSETQFILITHNKRSMEMADLLYGVTMPEPGVSRLVSMTLD